MSFISAQQRNTYSTVRFALESKTQHKHHTELFPNGFMNEFPKTLKIITIWLFIGTAVFLIFSWFESAQEQTSLTVNGNTIEIRKARDGHYHWRGEVNGQTVTFLIDTGASVTSIPESIAQKAQLPVIGRARFSTANGTTVNDIVRGDLTLEGGVTINNLRMGVLPSESDQALLGMDVIGKLHMTQSDGLIRFEH